MTNDFMEDARILATQCCKQKTDPALIESVAQSIASWMDAAARHIRNEEFYRDIVHEIGELFGDEAKTADDGTVMEDVLALKVPELVKKLKEGVTAVDAVKFSQVTTNNKVQLICDSSEAAKKLYFALLALRNNQE